MVEAAPPGWSRRNRLKDEDYNAAIVNNRANFNAKINAIMEKYSHPNVDERVVDLVSERFVSSAEEESPAEPPPLPHCKLAFQNGIKLVNSPLYSLSPSVSKVAVKAHRTNKGKLRHFPTLSFIGLHLKNLRKQRLYTLSSIAVGIRKRRAALHDCQTETREKISKRSFNVCEKKQTVPSVSQTKCVQRPVHIDQIMLSSARIDHFLPSPLHCKKTREVTDNNPRMYRDLHAVSSTWHSTPRPHQKEKENLCSPARYRQLPYMSRIEQSPVNSDKLHIHQISSNDNGMSEGAQNDESRDASSEEIDIQDHADTSRSSPRPCTVPTFHSNHSFRNGHDIPEETKTNWLRDDSSEELLLLSDVEDLADTSRNLADTSRNLPKPSIVPTFHSNHSLRNSHDIPEETKTSWLRDDSSEEFLLLSDVEDLADTSRNLADTSRNLLKPGIVPTFHSNHSFRNGHDTPEEAKNDWSRHDSSEEFLLLSDVEDLADTSRNLPKPCTVPTFPRINRPAATKYLKTRRDCRPPIPDIEFPDEMFEVVIIDDPAYAVHRPLPSKNADDLVTNFNQPAVYAAGSQNSEKINDDPDPKSDSSVSSGFSSCCVLLHYDKKASTKVVRVSGTGRSPCIFT